MPLEHGASKEAFSKNVATEMEAGKPQKQAVAIAYSEKNRTAHDAIDRLCSGVEALYSRMDSKFTGGLWGQEGGTPTRIKEGRMDESIDFDPKEKMYGAGTTSAGMKPGEGGARKGG